MGLLPPCTPLRLIAGLLNDQSQSEAFFGALEIGRFDPTLFL
jgi:hypothetical protein